MKRQKDNYVIRNKRQMRALAASTRQEIVDMLPRLGTLSVAELATALRRPADSLYYHLRILKRVGLVLTAGSRRNNGRREVLYRAVARELSLSYELGKNGNGNEVNAIIASMLRLGIRDFRNSFKAGEATTSGPDRELWALRRTAWLSHKQIVKVNRYLHQLMREMAVAERHGRLYAVTVVLTPLTRRRSRREPATESLPPR